MLRTSLNNSYSVSTLIISPCLASKDLACPQSPGLTSLPYMVQVQQEVRRLQSLVEDQLPQEKQHQQQRTQAISQALASPASPEVPHAGLLTCLCRLSPSNHHVYNLLKAMTIRLLHRCAPCLIHGTDSSKRPCEGCMLHMGPGMNSTRCLPA